MGEIIWDEIYDTEQGRVFIGHARFVPSVDYHEMDEDEEMEAMRKLSMKALDGTW